MPLKPSVALAESLNVRPGNNNPEHSKWPKGTKQPFTRKFAKTFCEILATSDDSVFGILHNHPEFPPYTDLFRWKRKYPFFKQLWQEARESQAEHFVQMSIAIAKRTTPATAHVSRIQFDIYRWVAGKFAPALYGDKPAQNAFQANVNVNVSLVTTDKLNELRQRLTPTRVFIKAKSEPQTNGNRTQPETFETPLNLPAPSEARDSSAPGTTREKKDV